MRVLMLGPFPRSASCIDGGVAAATMYLSQALIAQPDIELIGVRIMGGSSIGGMDRDLGWPVVDLELGRLSVSTLFLRQLSQFRRLAARYQPDLIHAQGADAAGYIAIKSGHPAIVTIHGILSECARQSTKVVGRLREVVQSRITEDFVVKRASHVISISPYVASHYLSRLRGAIHAIPNAVAPAYFQLQRKPEAGRFLFAGRISKGKGLSDLVEAIGKLRESGSVARVILAGASPDKAFEAQLRAETIARQVDAKFEFVGLLAESSLLLEFQRATALVLPSYQETAPMVVQQAMAAGLPVIATRVGGVVHMLEDDVSGLLFNAGDATALASLLRRIDEEQGLGARLAAAAREHARRYFSADQVARATLDAYRCALGRV